MNLGKSGRDKSSSGLVRTHTCSSFKSSSGLVSTTEDTTDVKEESLRRAAAARPVFRAVVRSP